MRAAANHFRQSLDPAVAVIIRAVLIPVVAASLATARPALAQPPNAVAVRVDAATEEVLDGALKYLASRQHLNGSWSIKEGSGGFPVAMTGYVLLAFMAMGNLPDRGEYAKNVASGTQYLLDMVQPDGRFRGVPQGQYMYNHGIASIALAEVFGQSPSPALHQKLERVIGLILRAQNETGGWRYSPSAKDADISVTVLQAVALRAALEAGIAVPQEALDNAIAYVHTCHVPENGGFAYQPGKNAGFARTAAAIYSLQVLGQYDDPKVKAGSDYLFKHIEEKGWWTYGHYYAAPAQYMIGGETWRDWYSKVKEMLMSKVEREGEMAHWTPVYDSKRDLGPIFSTAVGIHILAMPYHFVPLYQR